MGICPWHSTCARRRECLKAGWGGQKEQPPLFPEAWEMKRVGNHEGKPKEWLPPHIFIFLLSWGHRPPVSQQRAQDWPSVCETGPGAVPPALGFLQAEIRRNRNSSKNNPGDFGQPVPPALSDRVYPNWAAKSWTRLRTIPPRCSHPRGAPLRCCGCSHPWAHAAPTQSSMPPASLTRAPKKATWHSLGSSVHFYFLMEHRLL